MDRTANKNLLKLYQLQQLRGRASPSRAAATGSGMALRIMNPYRHSYDE